MDSVSYGVKVEDAVLVAEVKVDVMDLLKEMAKKSDNTIDDALVAIVAAAKDKMDWRGVAKTHM